MLANEIASAVRSALVEPVAGFFTDNELLSWLKRAENDYANRTRVLDDKAFTSTIAGVNEYPLPANCLSVRGVLINTGSSAPDWRRMVPSNLEKSMQEVPNFPSLDSDQRGDPRRYLVWGRTLFIFPTPKESGSSNIMMFYKSKPIPQLTLNDPINVDDTLAEGIIAYILWKAHEKENEGDKAEVQRQIYELYVKQGLRWAKKQSGDQRYKLDIASSTPFEGPFDGRFNPLI